MILAKTEKIAEIYEQIQHEACLILEGADGKSKFSSDKWEKKIGWGMTRVLQNGEKIAKAAVNFSFVSSVFSANMEKILGEKANHYAATGLSSIIHPVNPFAPIIHMNIRYFELDNGVSWFGGGIDLTPHYIDKKEAANFHKKIKTICDACHEDFYPDYKKWADDYFYLPHRQETRGIGGIFFDRLKPSGKIGFEQILDFTVELGKNYPTIYKDILNKKHKLPYSDKEINWQKIRRGRYVEFNLVYDRGTKFGLESGGNTESILVSLPPEASWEYDYKPEKGSEEEKTYNLLKKGINWV